MIIYHSFIVHAHVLGCTCTMRMCGGQRTAQENQLFLSTMTPWIRFKMAVIVPNHPNTLF